MEWRDAASVLAALLSLVCVVPYLRDVLAGRTTPHRMSWLVFASLSTAGACAQFAGDGWTSGVALAGGAALGFTTVFILAIPRGVGGSSTSDVVSIVALCLTLIIWSQTSNDRLVLALVIAVEIPAVVATARESRDRTDVGDGVDLDPRRARRIRRPRRRAHTSPGHRRVPLAPHPRQSQRRRRVGLRQANLEHIDRCHHGLTSRPVHSPPETGPVRRPARRTVG